MKGLAIIKINISVTFSLIMVLSDYQETECSVGLMVLYTILSESAEI